MSWRLATKTSLSLALIAGLGLIAVLAWSQTGDSEEDQDKILLSHASGKVTISNSKSGQAVLSAAEMAPGQTSTGSVVIGNRGDIPVKLHLSGELKAASGLESGLRLKVTSPSGTNLYSGSLSGLNKWVGVLQPDQRRRYTFEVSLPAASGNQLQGKAASLDLVWKGKGAAPPPVCRIRAIRSRFFVFKRRQRLRMVVRYRSNAAARVRLVFHERLPGGGQGRRIGAFGTRIVASSDQWHRVRIARRRSQTDLDELRRFRHGFIVRIRVKGVPEYCHRRLNLVLTQLRRVDRQFVWFQRGSFRRFR